MWNVISAVVATAANTYISGSQFTFKWNFHIGERSRTESLIYTRAVISREEQWLCPQSLQKQETKQNLWGMFVFSIICLHHNVVGKDVVMGGIETQKPSVPGDSWPVIGALGCN